MSSPTLFRSSWTSIGSRFCTAHTERPGDRRLQLVAVETWNQILTVADRLGKIAKPRAVAQEIGAHRENDIDGDARLSRRLEEQSHERWRVVAFAGLACLVGKSEKLFKLVDDDGNVFMRIEPRQATDVDQSRTAAPQRGLNNLPSGGVAQVDGGTARESMMA